MLSLSVIRYFVLASVVWTHLAQAIVIRHDVDDQKYQELGQGVLPLTSFIAKSENQQLVLGSGTYLSDGWVITAAHVAHYLRPGMEVQIAQVQTQIEHIHIHPKRQEDRPDYDIALVRLVNKAVEVPRVRLYQASDETGQIVTFAGRGDFGTGQTGIEHADQVLRGANNRVESVTPQWLTFVFDKPERALPLEGISGPGDSGGPAMVERNGELWLLGVSAWQNSETTGWQEGKYGVVEHYSRVSSFYPWLKSVMEQTK